MSDNGWPDTPPGSVGAMADVGILTLTATLMLMVAVVAWMFREHD